MSTVTQTRISHIVGNPVSLSCDTRANPSATAWEWFYNGYALSSTSKVLVVDRDLASDSGQYTCRAVNGIGTSSDMTFNIAVLIGTGKISVYICQKKTQSNPSKIKFVFGKRNLV